MSITKSYNKQTNTYYAYDTTYEWDEIRQKQVQRKRCIGKFDPITGEVVPNGKVGRHVGSKSRSRKNEIPVKPTDSQQHRQTQPADSINTEVLFDRCKKLEAIVSELSSEIRDLKDDINKLSATAQ